MKSTKLSRIDGNETGTVTLAKNAMYVFVMQNTYGGAASGVYTIRTDSSSPYAITSVKGNSDISITASGLGITIANGSAAGLDVWYIKL